MKAIVLSCLLLLSAQMAPAQLLSSAPDVPATAPNADFPVHVRILQNHWYYIDRSYQGYGRGDILGPNPVGFDFTYYCGQPFMNNEQRGEFYQGRWSRPDQRIELLLQKVGSQHLQHCEIKITLKPEAYGRYDANGVPLSETAPAAAVPPPVVAH
jgi:hypothetical protein